MYHCLQPARFDRALIAGPDKPTSARLQFANQAFHDGGATVEIGRGGRFEQFADVLEFGSRRSQWGWDFVWRHRNLTA
jgi:hypothetical protein